jgi:hypothetical protein
VVSPNRIDPIFDYSDDSFGVIRLTYRPITRRGHFSFEITEGGYSSFIFTVDQIRASGTHCTYGCLPDYPLEPNK